MRRLLALGLAGSLCLMAVEAAAQATAKAGAGAEAQLAMGQRIYREGIGASGQPVKAIGAAQASLSGKEVACVACHRRSGYGSSEGRLAIRPIIGPALRQEQTAAVQSVRGKARLGPAQRPPYTEESLARAIRDGVDAAGKPLDAAMPRYTLADNEMRAIAAYLFALSAEPSPGVDDRELHVATVIQPGVAAERRRAMLEVMQAFVRDKGGAARQEEQRRDAANMRMARAYRKWVLHVWELDGPSETWDAQLRALYEAQPVFALIGGLGSSSWCPIHQFAERLEIPSLFPVVEVPCITMANDYNLYLSRGVVLEAEVLAKFLGEQGDAGSIVQVYRRDDPRAIAASAFRRALPADAVLEDRVLDGGAGGDFWRGVYGERPGSLVLWLDTAEVEKVRPESDAQPAIYLSSSMLADRPGMAAAQMGSNVRLVYPSDLPPRRDARLLRDKLWLRNKGIPLTDETVQINTLFALTVASDALGHMMDSYSRDLFVERVEHAVGQTPTASIYPTVSLGPGQRFAAKGASVVQVIDAQKKELRALSGWIVP